MAIAFARISYHSRSQGHSAVAGIAYRAGVCLTDHRTGITHDFSNRSDVAFTEILLPEDAHDKFSDREFLWNEVERCEKRKNSQVAKDIVLALPCEVDLAHQIDLAREFADYHFVRHGLVADIAIHDHGDNNPHAHIYVTTRKLLGDKFDKHKARDLEPSVARGKVVSPQYWGEQWRDFQNDYFEKHHLEIIVDANHIISQRHQGRIRESEPKNNDGAHYLGEENRLRRALSVEIALTEPESLLNILGNKHAVFSEQDIWRLLNKNTRNAEEFQVAVNNLKAHRDLITLGPGDDGRVRYTTRANYLREAKMIEDVEKMQHTCKHTVTSKLARKHARLHGLNDEQSSALDYLSGSSDVVAVVGRAGTGKSYMLRAANAMWQARSFQTIGMTVSGIAARNLEESSGIKSRTIHSLKRQMALGYLKLSKNDILVMDEAGMTDLNDLAFMVNAARKSGAKLVLVGDHAQLQPIGPGAPFRAIVEKVGFATLEKIQRQQSSEDCYASQMLSQGKVGKAINHYANKNQVHLVLADEDEDNASLKKLITDWHKELSIANIHERIILAHRRVDVSDLNLAARQKLIEAGHINKKGSLFTGINGEIELAKGDRILFLRNDNKLGICNGDFATVRKILGANISVILNAGEKNSHTLTINTNEYTDFDYGYAATVHKTQGCSVEHVFVYIAGHFWDKFLAYVAMTRHKTSLNIYAEHAQFQTLSALKKSLSRSQIKDNVIDWPLLFSIRRGFDPDSSLGRFIDKACRLKSQIKDAWAFVVNYEMYLKNQSYKESIENREKNRLLAKQVALFVDLRNEISREADFMRQELSPAKKFFQHHNYKAWYEKCLKRDELASVLLGHYEAFKLGLTSNNINKNTLEKYATRHHRAEATSRYIHHFLQGTPETLAPLSKKDISDKYAHLAYCADKYEFDIKQLLRTFQQKQQPIPSNRSENKRPPTIDNTPLAQRKKLYDNKTTSTANYQDINDALIKMAETFYTQVLGDDCRRVGNQLRFGRNGSLSVALSGEHRGCWHSFESGQGGGPLQLLMDNELGWGLSYSDAAREGAQMAGLFHENKVKRQKRATVANDSIKNQQDDPDLIAKRYLEEKAKEQAKKVSRARYYYQSAQPIEGTLGERYLRNYRHIAGNISAFKYHPKIRDDHPELGTHYYPGLVIAAENPQGDITGTQTILLDPGSGKKLDKDIAGAVKRSRGEIKGSAVCIHRGASNQVIIAEGPETGVSLIDALPEANIYVTLGNIKNAMYLGWLAEKHQTKSILFAIDNDGPGAHNLQSLQKVAHHLQDQHNITTLATMAYLPSREKCDFNDVLIELGAHNLKRQLSNTKPLLLDREQENSLTPIENHARLCSALSDWQKIEKIDHPAIKHLIESKHQRDRSLDTAQEISSQEKLDDAIVRLYGYKEITAKATIIAPSLVKEFNGTLHPKKPCQIDWLAKEYDHEIRALVKSENDDIKTLIRFRKMLSEKKDRESQNLIQKEMRHIASRIVESGQNRIFSEMAPKLSKKMKLLVRYRAREKGFEREL